MRTLWWRRLPRFRITTLFAVTTAVCLVAAYERREGERERDAALHFQGIGGSLLYSAPKPSLLHVFCAAHKSPLHPTACSGHVVALNLSEVRVEKRDALRIGRLSYLTHLYLDGAEVDDEDAQWLAVPPRVKEVSLCATDITDESVEALTRLSNVRALSIVDTGISKDGAGRLERALQRTRVRHNWNVRR